MPTYLLRMSCDYYLTVEAENESHARQIGNDTVPEQWEGYSWSDMEVEPEPSDTQDEEEPV